MEIVLSNGEVFKNVKKISIEFINGKALNFENASSTIYINCNEVLAIGMANE